jgi:uncharacterized protein (DUF2062 family)
VTFSSRVTAPRIKERLVLAWRRLRGGTLSPQRASLSVAIGLFVGALPIYGFQLFLVLAICIPLRLDAAVAYVAAHIANPVTIPFLVALEIEIGALALTGEHARLDGGIDPTRLGEFALQLAIGAPILALSLAAVGAIATLGITARRATTDLVQVATERTLRRYRHGKTGERMYVRAKLEADPLARVLMNLPGSFGRLTDAGCGRGQVGLFLLDVGKAAALFGFDPEARAIQLATGAGTDATFQQASFAEVDWPPADTVLFADSLHYVPVPLQELALARAADSLAPGGRLIVREVDATPGWRSTLTRLSERLSAVLRRRRSAHGYRSAAALGDYLTSLGLEVERLPPLEWGPFEDAVLVARKPS